MTTMRRLLVLPLLAASLLLASCSTVEFAYNNAPGYLAGEFEDAFDANDAQREQADLALARFFAWHRQHELEIYRQTLDGAASQLGDGVSAEEFLDIVGELRQAWHRSLARLSEDFTPVLSTLSADQIDHYERYFRDKSERYDEYLAMTEDERREFRVEEELEDLEDWFGELSAAQRNAFAARLRQLPEFYLAWITYREERNRAFVDALRRAPTDGLTPSQLQHVVFGPDSDYTRTYQQVRVDYWKAYSRMIEDLGATLTSMQVEHAVDRLRHYADDIGELARAD